MDPTELDETDGQIINGVQTQPGIVLATLKTSQLFKLAEDPRRSEDATQRATNVQIEALYQIRREVQRMFTKAKLDNVRSYAEYIVGLRSGLPGITPPIVLYTENELRVASAGRGGVVKMQVPWDVQLTAIDGETQLAARYEAIGIDAATKDDFVGVMICHGRSLAWARQAFHDLNTLGIRVNSALAIGMDARDAMTQVTREVEDRVPFFTKRVNKSARQLGRGDREVVTITALRGACVTLAEGIGGVKFGAKPVQVDAKRVPQITAVAVEWFRDVTALLGPAMEDRERTVAAAPPIMAAIGAMGHELAGITDPAARAAQRARLVDRLRTVNWERGVHWEGIVGKFTPKGAFSIGGPKETAYAVYAALADETSSGYARIRVASANPQASLLSHAAA